MTIPDYFAELYVAGLFADAGWNVYFPHRDKGFDFIMSKLDDTGNPILRPVQVKGKYPTGVKVNKVIYGYVGRLSQLHPEMVLAIPFFSAMPSPTPTCVAYMPISLVRSGSRGFRCQSASFKSGTPAARRDYARFFDTSGLKLLESRSWKDSKI